MMTKTKTNILKTITLVCMSMLLTACSLGGGSSSESIAKKIKKEANLSTFAVGTLNLKSISSYYTTAVSDIKKYTVDSEAYGLTEEEVKSLEATGTIAQFFLDNVTSVDDEAKVNATYIGTETNRMVNGLFIYQVKDGISLSSEVIEAANETANDFGEYYVVGGNYIVTIDERFVSGNGLDIDELLEKIQTVLDKA